MMKTEKKSKKVKFAFYERNLTTLENMIGEDLSSGEFTEVSLRNPETGEERLILLPKLSERENAPDKLVKYGEIMQLLNNEQDWCLDHADEAPSQEFLRGFLDGLAQAKHFLTALVHLEESNPKPGWMGDFGGPGCDPADR